ncbi:MAG: EscU/YscU/HrcU family type III secretion system export apparatus switch protein [Bryobacteraceae bacterium]|jgi:flagellar biosynthetic protein FlhB
MTHSGEKTEKATPRRLLKARREGQVASSREFVSGMQFCVFVFLLAEGGQKLLASLKQVTRFVFVQAFRSDLSPAVLVDILHQAFSQALVPVLEAGSLLVLSSFAFQLTTTGFSMNLNRLAPKGANFNFLSKLKSAPQQGLLSALQAVALLLVFGFTIEWIVTQKASQLLLLPLSSLDVGLRTVSSLSMDVLWKAASLFVLFGLVDLFRQKRRFASQMKMSKQDVRDEQKETEGSPQIKMRIRRLQRDVRRRRMMDQVKTATALIVNPTHYAVAIRYHHESMPAPVVVAKGKNYLAQRIRARALEHQIPLIENPPLAQALYKSADVGQQIPPHLYRAVAEILAYIYKLMGTKTV